MWGSMEEISPALAAPGSNSYGNGNRSTGHTDGNRRRKKQALSGIQSALVKDYLPLAKKLTQTYHGRGLSHQELYAGAEDGLLWAAINFDPKRGFPFPAYARPCIKGGILALFKKNKVESLTNSLEHVEAEAPVELPTVDLTPLPAKEQQVVIGRANGETLREIGGRLGISGERVRQLESRATSKLRAQKGKVALTCIRDLKTRRGYQRPSHPETPFNPDKHRYPCRTYSAEEIAQLVSGRPDLEGSR